MSGHFESKAVSDVMSFSSRLSGHFLATFFIGSGQSQKDSHPMEEKFRLSLIFFFLFGLGCNADRK
jgi:hypothetical protein